MGNVGKKKPGGREGAPGNQKRRKVSTSLGRVWGTGAQLKSGYQLKKNTRGGKVRKRKRSLQGGGVRYDWRGEMVDPPPVKKRPSKRPK